MMSHRFPDGFLWGAATASYQIEGAVTEDGRGPSIWDTFSHTPGMVHNDETGDVACDHYHRWPEDVKLMEQLGLRAYRFSIAWPRVLPDGADKVNEAGLDHYERLVDALLAAHITPFVTLYHWDLPQAMQDRGGWPQRDTAYAFAAYADVVARRLGDRVNFWITHNEPEVTAFSGHHHGNHAPGVKDLGTALQVAHHLLLSHGLAATAVRATHAQAQVGITLNLHVAYPVTDSSADEAAAGRSDGRGNRWFLDPVFGRGYPQDMVEWYGGLVAEVQPGDHEMIAAPLDFLGVNYYSPHMVRSSDRAISPFGYTTLSPAELAAEGYEITDMGWPVVPRAFTELLTHLHKDYSPKAIYVTENGAAFADKVVHGAVHDPRRIAYLHDHIAAAGEAIAADVPLHGYFVWTLMDNFEWRRGYAKRFGLIYVNYDTQARMPKDSFAWYRRVIQENALVDAEVR